MSQQIPPAPKTQEELQSWVNDLETPMQMRTMADAKIKAKKDAMLMALRQMVAMKADEELFWIAIGHLWNKYHTS